MIVKKYPQSHLLITGQKTKIVIDPGYITFDKGFFKVSEFQGMSGYLITHIHKDHVDPRVIKEVVGDNSIFANVDAAHALNNMLGLKVTTVLDRQKFKVGEFNIEVVDLPHFKATDGLPGPHNSGFLINGVFFHPGDSVQLPNITSPNTAVSVAHPTIYLEEPIQFIKHIKAKVVIPIHYDVYPVNLEELKKRVTPDGVEVRILNWGEETII